MSQNDIIELVELESITSSKSTKKPGRRKNKISSPPELPSSPQHEPSASYQPGNIHSLFQAKTQTREAPKPLPRKRQRKVSENISATDTIGSSILPRDDLTEHSGENSEIHRLGAKTYKDKIRERFKTVKSQAGTSTYKASIMRQSAEKIMDQLRRESRDIDVELQNARSRLNLNETIPKNLKSEFFCAEAEEEKNDEETDNQQKGSTADLLDDADNKELTVYKSPENRSLEITESEKEFFFFPTGKALEVNDKIKGDVRFLEHEGLYVPKYPSIRKRHLNMVERRLLCLDDTKWFNCQGDMNLLENPISDVLLRPDFPLISSKETTIFLPASLNSEMETVVVMKENLLELKMSELKFKHHHLFSIEHVFEQRLLEAFECYEDNMHTSHLERIGNRLEALRQVKANMALILKQSGDTILEVDKMKKYEEEIKSLREKLFAEGKKHRECLKRLLESWKAIKQIRKENKYSSTSVKLIIRKQNVDYETEKEKYDDDIEETYKEIIGEHKRESEERVMEIESQNVSDNGDQEQEDCSGKTISKKTRTQIRRDLEKRFQESFKPPGEPILHFSITSENEITREIDNNKEILRRNTVLSTKIYLRILCNKVEVTKSKPAFLNETFSCSFLQNFSIQLTDVPKSLTIEILEQPSSLQKRKLGEVSINVPNKNTSIGQSKYKTVTFEKTDIIHYKHEGIGSGEVLMDLVQKYDMVVGNQDEKMFTRGIIYYKIGWNIKRSACSADSAAAHQNHMPYDIINKSGGIDMQKLHDWMNCNTPDPQDPKNSVLFEYTEDYDDKISIMTNKDKKYFRLNPYMKSLQFCDLKVIEENLRLQLLKLRNDNVPEFDGMIIPNRVKEISPSLLLNYRKRLMTENDSFLLDDEDEEIEIDQRKKTGHTYLKQIYIRVFQKCKTSQYNLKYEDVVDEKYLVHFEKFIRALIENIINWFKWQPKSNLPLVILDKSESDKPRQVLLSNISAKIVIKVKSAINIPTRKASTFCMDGKTGLNDVRAYIEISCQNIIARSSTIPGSNPIWNDEITIPLESLHTDYLNPDSLSGSININIFDEDHVENKSYQGKRRNLLGYLDIPVSAACQGEDLDGSFRVNVPYMLLGYETETDKLLMKSPKMQNFHSDSKYQTYLNLNVSISPNIPKLSPSMDELPTNDLPMVTDHVMRWNEAYNKSYPKRSFSALAINRNGKTTCITRYLKPLEPPQITTEGFDITADQCARYVSMIPFTDCNQFYQNVWLPTNRFLEIMTGSIIDHAVALTCFLMALQLEVWLLLGFGLPRGSTAYVLIKEFTSDMPTFSVYDVVTAEKYDILDPYCPLRNVYCVVNEQNVFANVQRNDTISLLRFDFTRRSDWLPLFDGNFQAPTNSIQSRLLHSHKTVNQQLELIIDRKIRKRISKMRALEPTIWNRTVSNHFKNSFYAFELNTMYGKSSHDMLTDLQKILIAQEVTGFVICLPYVNMSSVMKRIKQLGIHNQLPSVEFASSVHIHSYPNQTVVVWILLAVVNNK